MGNHGTTMFDELRACSITIHCPDSHTSLGTRVGSIGGFHGTIFFPSALRLSVPKNVKGLRNNKFRGTPTREQTAYIPWKDTIYKKSWGDTKKVVDTGAKYPQPESLVLSIFYQQNIEQHVQDCLLGHVGSCSIPRKY